MKKALLKLNEYKDLKFRKFISSLIPSVLVENIIGIKIPVLRKLSKEFTDKEKKEFINILPHRYLEEYLLHSFFLDEVSKDIDELFLKLDELLPYVDNWCVCDTMNFKLFKSNKKTLFEKVLVWLESENEYTVRFAIVTIIKHFINDEYIKEVNKILSKIKRDEYYINMALAWYYTTALTKYYKKTIKYVENKNLSKYVHNKTISKCIDNRCFSLEIKQYLKTLKIK